MEVDGEPSVRVCTRSVEGGEQVRSQVVTGSLERDPMRVVDRVGGPFTPVGFYYRTGIRPKRAWPYIERALRRMTGLGRVGTPEAPRRSDVEHRLVDVLVVGGGRSGRAAADHYARGGREVVLVDERPESAGLALDGVEVLAPARALGVFEGRLVPVHAGDVLHRIRARHVVVATGTVEQPLLFDGNDLPGVMTPGAVLRMIELWSVRPGSRAVVLAADESALAAADAAAGRRRRRHRDRRPARAHAEAEGARAPRPADRRRDRRPPDRLRSARRLRRAPARVLADRPGGRHGPLRRDRRHLRPGRAPRRDRGRRLGRRLARGCARAAAARADERPLLRLPLRGRHREGPAPRRRRGVRRHRDRQALHDGDDGAVPGPPVPARLGAPARPGDRDRRGGARHDDRAAAVDADAARRDRRATAGPRQAHAAARPPRRGRRAHGLDRTLAAAGPLRRRGGGDPRRARRRRAHGRLHARQADGERARRPALPRRRVPEPDRHARSRGASAT